MDNVEDYGPVAHRLAFSEAIKKKLLTDYEIVVVGVDDPAIAEGIKDREFLMVDGHSINAEELAAHIAIHRTMEKKGTRRMLTFHSRVNQAENFSKNIPIVKDWLKKNRRLHAPKIWGDWVSGEMSVSKREKVLQKLDSLEDGGCGIVSNARCLGEGVDVPSIDGISFVQPKRSAIDIVQAVGRAIRKSAKKDGVSTIILPVPILDSEDATSTVESSSFETVWRVLEALRSHDDELSESLDGLRTQLGERLRARISVPKITWDMPRSVDVAFNDSLRLEVLEHTTDDFWVGLGRLKAYKAEHGHVRVHNYFKTEDGFGLGGWVGNRRRGYKKGQLSEEKIQELENLGFVWDARNSE